MPENNVPSVGEWFLTQRSRSIVDIESPSWPGQAIAKVFTTNPKTRKHEAEFGANVSLLLNARRLQEIGDKMLDQHCTGEGVSADLWLGLHAILQASHQPFTPSP